MNILDEIAERTRIRTEEDKKDLSPHDLKEMVLKKAETEKKEGYRFPFENALKTGRLSIIAEVKKSSPSKGLIAPEFDYISQASAYEEGGASCISVLTEPYYFGGSSEFLREIREKVSLPILRKDFTIDEYMIFDAKRIGADAVLLILSILSDEEAEKFFKLSDSLGLTAVFEAHDETEVKRALGLGARVIGVNNRNLKDFSVDFENSLKFRNMIPKGTVYISESGVKGEDDIKRLSEAGIDACLVGEALMRASDPAGTLKSWIMAM